MKRFACIYVWLLCLVLSVAAQEKVVKLKIVQTSDVHGNYYPYNFITRKDWQGSLARIYAFVQKEREQYKENLSCSTTAIYCKGNLPPITIII